jgi:hypothetical protein
MPSLLYPPRKAKRCTCGHIVCVCGVREQHDAKCRFRISMLCPIGIACEHGYDVCPKCDPCTCAAARPQRRGK